MISYHIVSCSGFNTQPPEGGCQPEATLEECIERFQHTATRRWLRATTEKSIAEQLMVSTHSHPKVAASMLSTPTHRITTFQHTATRRWLPVACGALWVFYEVSTHSHPKVAAATWIKFINFDKVSTHSHPKVAAQELNKLNENLAVSTHSHPKVAARYIDNLSYD